MRGLFSFRPYIARDRRCGEVGFDFWIADRVAKAWYDSSAEQGLPEKIWCRDHIRPGFHAVDCGAHHGMMSVLFSKWVGPNGTVTAYEVVPKNRKVIQRNLELNGCSNVMIRAAGVGARSERKALSANGGNATSHPSRFMRRLDVVSLDDDLGDRRVDFLKVDVEGSEVATLHGAARILQRDRPALCIEVHTFLFRDPRAAIGEIFSILDPLDYRYELLGDVLGAVSALPKERLAAIAAHNTPHLLCTPIGQAVA